jgi:hypothetical protein
VLSYLTQKIILRNHYHISIQRSVNKVKPLAYVRDQESYNQICVMLSSNEGKQCRRHKGKQGDGVLHKGQLQQQGRELQQ